jgi:uncharacterized protein (TIGR00725 family)
MSTPLYYCPESATLRLAGRRFDCWNLAWRDDDTPLPGEAQPLSARAAVAQLHSAGLVRAVPVGVIGPKAATTEQLELAEKLGRRIAALGLQLLCGGKNGVMETVCRGNLEAGGRPIGLIPDEEWEPGNAYVSVPIATGIGPARNAIVARGCFALVAIGGGYGTLSEMALGLHFNRLVLAVDDAPQVEGAIRCRDLEEVEERLAQRFLKLDSLDA